MTRTRGNQHDVGDHVDVVAEFLGRCRCELEAADIPTWGAILCAGTASVGDMPIEDAAEGNR